MKTMWKGTELRKETAGMLGFARFASKTYPSRIPKNGGASGYSGWVWCPSADFFISEESKCRFVCFQLREPVKIAGFSQHDASFAIFSARIFRMNKLTNILCEIGNSPLSNEVSNRLFGLVYDELRQMAAKKLRCEAPGQTLQATALVHEVWLRLLDCLGSPEKGEEAWQNRQYFFGAAAEAMRRILIEKARFKKRLKRGGPNAKRQGLSETAQKTNPIEDDVLDLHSALEAFEKVDSTKAQIVKLKFFVGLTTNEIAEATQLSVATVERYWVYARAWLYQRMGEQKSHD